MTDKVLVLDFGGVVTRTLFETHRESEAALGLAAGSLTWRGPFDPAGDPLWQDMIADKISERAYWLARAKETGALLGKNWTTMQEFVRAARSASAIDDVIRPAFLSTCQRAKAAGVRLAILSNELDLFYGRDFRDKLPFLADFDPIIDATYTKILKPDEKAYELVAKATGLPPAKHLFVDDQIRNIKGAEDFGMQTIHFDVTNPQTSYNQVISKLGI